MTATLIKICGVTSCDQAIAAAATGAEFLGLVLAEGSVRTCSMAEALRICRRLRQYCRQKDVACPAIVGVFKGDPAGLINRAAAILNLDYVQLHGLETPDFCRKIKFPVIKAILLEDALDMKIVDSYRDCSAYLLFDRPEKRRPDFHFRQAALEILAQARPCLPEFFFAGGLDSANVGEVVCRLSPFAVDASSGLELSPGIKDSLKMQKFVQAVRQRQPERRALPSPRVL
jgi:phosphoribosylanthranilate isomerase